MRIKHFHPVGFVFAIVLLFSSLCVSFAEEKWNESRSEHFIVYFRAIPEDFIDEVKNDAEEYYKSITENLGFARYNFWLWDKRAKFYIYNDSGDYIRQTNQPAWSAGAVHYQEKIIMTYPQMAGFFDSVMPHELGHIIFREFIGGGSKIPLWFEEGVASYQERSKRLGADKIVIQAINDKNFIPLEDLSKMDIRNSFNKAAVELFYAEAISVVSFIISEFGKEHFGWFCRDIRDGKAFEDALWRFNCRDLAALNKRWTEYLKNKPR
ncbi:MAG: peptidase MA family metallohydrolase [Candidatus Omnitrophota bacterium]|nr:peptidase MA family metallohydrolase [Candidatus Omnitrophota bacterium]